VWFTGIVVLSLVLPGVWAGLPAPEGPAVLTPAVDRFATVALVSIAVAGVTGVLNSFLHVAALNDLVDTGYGRSLVVKLALFVALLGFGAVNHFVVRGSLVRALKEGNPTSAPRLFRMTIAAELLIALGIMGVTGLLVGLDTTRL
jgi:putative copper export protein